MPQEKNLPTYLSHYPLKYIEYFDSDGVYAGETDAQFLSLGSSTWNNQDISLKVWRKGGKNDAWSRQSEELPIHRPIDLVLLLLAILGGESSLTLNQNKGSVAIQENQPLPYKIKSLQEYLNQNFGNGTKGSLLKDRLAKLRDELNELSKKGII